MLGGTFDPVHLGHLVVASEIHDALGFDEIVLVPTGRPWQKADRDVTDGPTRLELTRLAVAADERFTVSAVDVDRPGPTYSIDTVRDLRAQYGDDTEFSFLVGADALAGLPSWHEIAALLDTVHVVGFARPGHRLAVPDGLPATARDRIRLIETTAIGVSSTAVRERVRAGRTIRYLVPDAVGARIAELGLYRDAA